MTPQRAKQILTEFTAYAEGKAVQCRHNASIEKEWKDVCGHFSDWENPQLEFRIKPVPREFWLVRYTLTPNYAPQTHEFVAYPTEREARAALCRAGFNRDAQLIHVLEVPEAQ